MPANNHNHNHILIVGVNARNLELLSEFLGKQGHRSVSAQNLEQLDEIIQSRSDLALALVDVSGFNTSIWERCQKIHDKNIRLLIISPKQSTALQKESLTHGAQGVLVKPLVMRELADLIRDLMEE